MNTVLSSGRIRLPIAILFIALGISYSYGQNKAVEQIIEKVDLFTKGLPQEKIFLHTDRAYYGSGETIWFQSYAAAGSANLPSTLSQTVYTQLIDSNDSLIYQVVTESINGFGSGYIDLPPNLADGKYQLVSFTNWMKNFGEEYFFRKAIRIVNNDVEVLTSAVAQQNIDLQFFPESGNLVDQIPTKIAFKAIDENGLGVNIKGKILGSNGEEYDLVSDYDGMGQFFLTPTLGVTYYGQIEGIDEQFPLQEVQKEGFSLRTSQTQSDPLKITTLRNGRPDAGSQLQLIIHQRGRVLYSVEINQKGSISIAEVPTEKFPLGIVSITLFDEKGVEPLAERLVFVENLSSQISISQLKKEYGIRDEVNLELALSSAQSDSLSGVFSVSVIDLNQSLELEPERTVLTELLLNSDLKGHISNPSYYFDPENSKRKEHLDLVMLTHGWRRFVWNEILNEDIPAIDYVMEKGVQLKGQIVREFSNDKAEANASVSLINPALGIFLETETDRNGEFSFEDLGLTEDDDVILKAERQRGNKTNVTYLIDSTTFKTGYSRYHEKYEEQLETGMFLLGKKTRDKIDSAYAYLYDSSAIMLGDFVLEGTRVADEETQLKETSFGKGTDAIDFDNPMFMGQFDPIGALRGKFPGVDISGFPGSYNVSIRQAGRINPSPPLFLLDDVPVSIDLINSMSIDQIEKVVLFKGLSSAAVLFGESGVGGVLAFYTKKGADSPSKSLPNTGVITRKVPNAYQLTREFYAPKYETKKPEHIRPDRRILLHWQPMLELNNWDKAKLKFWTSDLETTMLINIQGLTYLGEPISQSFYLDTVKN